MFIVYCKNTTIAMHYTCTTITWLTPGAHELPKAYINVQPCIMCFFYNSYQWAYWKCQIVLLCNPLSTYNYATCTCIRRACDSSTIASGVSPANPECLAVHHIVIHVPCIYMSKCTLPPSMNVYNVCSDCHHYNIKLWEPMASEEGSLSDLDEVSSLHVYTCV